MEEKLFIPKKLNIGYVKRDDTYTGQLAYIIYWDSKNKLRKEGSWESWRDKTIDPNIYDNEPIEGFVLNKNIGGVGRSWNWNERREKIRVFDPRGFEFEITVENVLFILEECTSTKGKGLEGKFVYAWDGPELILLPVDTYEYKQCVGYTDLQSMKIDKSSMVPGCSYTFKDTESYVYLGRLNYYQRDGVYYNDPKAKYDYERKKLDYYATFEKKGHIFYRLDENGKADYRIESGFTKLATRDTEIPLSNYAELIEEYQSSSTGGKCLKLIVEDVTINLGEEDINNTNAHRTSYASKYYLENSPGKFTEFTIKEDFSSKYDQSSNTYTRGESFGFESPVKNYNHFFWFENDQLKSDYDPNRDYYAKNITLDQLLSYKFKKVSVLLENGTLMDVSRYFNY